MPRRRSTRAQAPQEQDPELTEDLKGLLDELTADLLGECGEGEGEGDGECDGECEGECEGEGEGEEACGQPGGAALLCGRLPGGGTSGSGPPTSQQHGEQSGAMAPRGSRPRKLSLETTARFTRAIKLGCTVDAAADYAGVHRTTVWAWMRGGREGKSPAHVAFAEAVDKAMADFRVAALARIHLASNDWWQAAAWLLERRFPEEFALRNRLELTGRGGEPVQVVVRYAPGHTPIYHRDPEAAAPGSAHSAD